MSQAAPLESVPTRAASSLTPPAFAMPPGACDAHVHVFGPASRYPSVATPHYTLPDGEPPKLLAMTAAMGLERFAIVQPSYYATDNRCLLDALDTLGQDIARGVVMIEDTITDRELDAMHEQGVRAVRLDLFLRASWPIASVVDYIRKSAQRIRRLGWHVQFYTPGYVVRDLIPFMKDFDFDFVIDHMGYMLESDGLTRADFDRLVTAARDGRGWLKLSAPYRLAKDGNFARLRPLAETIVAELGDRTVWGSDWPHIPRGDKDTGDLLNLLGDWIPDANARNKVLSGNPARLYQFEA